MKNIQSESSSIVLSFPEGDADYAVQSWEWARLKQQHFISRMKMAMMCYDNVYIYISELLGSAVLCHMYEDAPELMQRLYSSGTIGVSLAESTTNDLQTDIHRIVNSKIALGTKSQIPEEVERQHAQHLAKCITMSTRFNSAQMRKVYRDNLYQYMLVRLNEESSQTFGSHDFTHAANTIKSYIEDLKGDLMLSALQNHIAQEVRDPVVRNQSQNFCKSVMSQSIARSCRSSTMGHSSIKYFLPRRTEKLTLRDTSQFLSASNSVAELMLWIMGNMSVDECMIARNEQPWIDFRQIAHSTSPREPSSLRKTVHRIVSSYGHRASPADRKEYLKRIEHPILDAFGFVNLLTKFCQQASSFVSGGYLQFPFLLISGWQDGYDLSNSIEAILNEDRQRMRRELKFLSQGPSVLLDNMLHSLAERSTTNDV
jgi:hypothetical protein